MKSSKKSVPTTSIHALLRLLHMVDEHHPTFVELELMTDASAASLKRAFRLLREVGAMVEPVRVLRPHTQPRIHYEVTAWGVFTRDGVLAHVERQINRGVRAVQNPPAREGDNGSAPTTGQSCAGGPAA